jgi:hypothetical protein
VTQPEDLPRWVWDVVADIVEYEGEHGEGQRCLEPTLARIPEDVRRTAAVILRYRSSGVVYAEIVEDPS